MNRSAFVAPTATQPTAAAPAPVGRVLLACYTFAPAVNGMATVMSQYAAGFRRLGYEVEVVTSPDPARSARPDGVKVTEFAIRGNGRLGNPFRGQIAAYQDFLRAYDGDVVVFHGWESWPSELAVPLVASMKARTVMASHGTSYHWRDPSPWGWLRWLAFRPFAWTAVRKLRCFDEYVFLTDLAEPVRFNDRLLAERLGVTNWRVIPNGADPAYLEAEDGAGEDFRRRHGIRAARVLLCVSNYGGAKGQRELLDAFLRTNLPDTALVLVGSEPNAFSASLQRRAGQALNERVFVLAGLPPGGVRAAYRAADLFVTATRTEAQPLMLLDAMAAGLPFVAPPVGCIAELPGGRVFRTPAEFSAEVERLLADEPRRRQLGERGREAVQQRYNWGNAVAQYHRLFEELKTTRR